MAKRIQLSRRKGWRMPAGAVKVDRSTPHGNPFQIFRDRFEGGSPFYRVTGPSRHWYPSSEKAARRFAVFAFRRFAKTALGRKIFRIDELRGKDLACWCEPGEPCHADVLLELANTPDDAE
jgi:hypothetical protein